MGADTTREAEVASETAVPVRRVFLGAHHALSLEIQGADDALVAALNERCRSMPGCTQFRLDGSRLLFFVAPQAIVIAARLRDLELILRDHGYYMVVQTRLGPGEVGLLPVDR